MMSLAERLYREKTLPFEELKALVETEDEDVILYLRSRAEEIRDESYGRNVFLRALIEFTNWCKCDCLYCGIRCSNRHAERYRLSPDVILSAVEEGYRLGFRTVVLQGGEDPYFTDERLIPIVREIRSSFDVRITLSVGERSYESYERLYDAGASRYLLRHESITASHFARLHPPRQTLDGRIKALKDLKDIGYQVGCGFMVGSPFQTSDDITRDLLFIKEFTPHMVGIGPFIAQQDTPFASYPNGSASLTLKLLSIIRIMNPFLLLPATTALATVRGKGEIEGLGYGANVIMPNITPKEERRKYRIYDDKAYGGLEAAENVERLKWEVGRLGYSIPVDYGDSRVVN